MQIINNRFLSLYDYNFLLVIEKIFLNLFSKICGSTFISLIVFPLVDPQVLQKNKFLVFPGSTCNFFLLSLGKWILIKTRMKFPSPGHQPLFNYKEMWPGEWNFIKTTYDISLDSQISLLPFGFSLQLWESRYLLILSQGRFLSEFSFLGNDQRIRRWKRNRPTP